MKKTEDRFPFIKSKEAKEKLESSYSRIERAYTELLSGYELNAKNVLKTTLEVEPNDYNGLVIMRDINYYTFCEHHFLPFFGTCDIIYKPNKIITGIGKLVRLVRDVHSKRLQIQELMTRDIAEDIMRELDPLGVKVITRATHLCICSRGPNDDNTETVVEYELGKL